MELNVIGEIGDSLNKPCPTHTLIASIQLRYIWRWLTGTLVASAYVSEQFFT